MDLEHGNHSDTSKDSHAGDSVGGTLNQISDEAKLFEKRVGHTRLTSTTGGEAGVVALPAAVGLAMTEEAVEV